MSADGSPLSFTVLIRGESPDGQKAAKLMKEWFKEAGIDLKVETIDEGMLTDKILEGDFDLFMWGWFVDIDPSSILKIMTTDEIMSWNDCFYSNSKFDEIFKRQQFTLDPEERQELIFELQRMVYEDAPYIIISYDPELQAYRTDRLDVYKRQMEGPGLRRYQGGGQGKSS